MVGRLPEVENFVVSVLRWFEPATKRVAEKFKAQEASLMALLLSMAAFVGVSLLFKSKREEPVLGFDVKSIDELKEK